MTCAENDIRVLGELWAGKHPPIPDPSDYYKPGIWLIKKISEHEGHMEWLMSEEDLEALRQNQLPF